MQNIVIRAWKRVINDLWFDPDPGAVMLFIIFLIFLGAALGFFGV